MHSFSELACFFQVGMPIKVLPQAAQDAVRLGRAVD